MQSKNLNRRLQNISDSCVKCGVCLPHCPTYQLRGEEIESPRGRISLAQGLLHGNLRATESVRQHLGQCLSCGRCETICPANVEYEFLMDQIRFQFATTPHNHIITRKSAARLLSSPRMLSILTWLASILQAMGWLNFWRTSPRSSAISRLSRWLPSPISRPPRTAYKSTNHIHNKNSDVLLFCGCIPFFFEYSTVRAAQALAQFSNFKLGVLSHTACCGALYQHLGDANNSRRSAEHWLEVFKRHPNTPVASLTTGCAKGLTQNLKAISAYSDDNSTIQIVDIHALFFEKIDRNRLASLPPTKDNVGLYTPCTASPALAEQVDTLIRSVPGTHLTHIPQGLGCCGAAGDHMLRDHTAASKICAPITQHIKSRQYTHVLVPNSGCAWHLRAQLHDPLNLPINGSRDDLLNEPPNEHTTKVMHPLEWLWQQVRRHHKFT